MNNKSKKTAGLMLRHTPLAAAMLAVLGSPAAFALPSIEFDNGLVIDSQITANYTYSLRTRSADSEYLQSLNNDDGTRNFDRYAPINNRVSVFGEIIVTKDNYGAVVRGSHFYDDVYKSDNDNDAADMVNRVVAQPGDHQRFVSKTRNDSGSRFQLLDAYVYGNWPIGDDQYLSLNAGRHLVAWGESLFWPNISQGQAPVDATKFNVPGTEAKDAYLPVNQLSFSWALNDRLAFTGFYQLEWEKTRLNPVGDFFSTTDFFGPGAQFMRFAPGVISNLPDGAVVASAGDRDPRDSGQWGLGVRWNIDFNTEVGLYHYRYHDRVASMFLDMTGNSRYSSLGSIDKLDAAGPVIKFGYFEDIKLTGLSLSSKVGDVQLGSDISLRQDAPVMVASGAPTTGELLMASANFMYMLGPNSLASQTTLMGELVNQHILDADTLSVTAGGITTTDDDYVFDGQTRSSTLLGLGVILDYPSIFTGWDLSLSGTWQQNLDGSAYQGLGRGEKTLTLGADFAYLGNFEVGATWVNYLSSPDIDKGRVMADRDYLSFNVKYTF
ncbi:DUF1302 family protein [Halopseudomonas sp. SMJS2]|uniref:DUF1302 domain-containing protein n=1 Tax=Halopseudomonas sp. SMJS2 TaxID=3041098 RepID=UPI002452ADCF|nr:DUF1302 family protein [Halopseudomonas sp. SMJS2]WGK60861.1 DUF1302 family protein [Halopseudomonas sp. SMJS2]